MRSVRTPMVVTVLLLAAIIGFYAFPGVRLLVALAVSFSIVPIGLTALLVTGTVVALWRRHWTSGVTMLAGFFLLFAAAGVPSPVQSLCRKGADVIHVMWFRNSLEMQARSLRERGISPTVAVIAIDGFGSMRDGIAYDPSGEIMLQPDKRSAEWVTAAGQSELGIDGLQVRHIVGNYYSWFHY